MAWALALRRNASNWEWTLDRNRTRLSALQPEEEVHSEEFDWFRGNDDQVNEVLEDTSCKHMHSKGMVE